MTALDGLSITFDPGFNVVLGPNGSGKTTLFRVGAGVLPPDNGEVTIDGTNPVSDPSVKTQIGYLPHGTPLNGQLTVRENLDYWGRVLSLDAQTRAERIEQTTATMDVESLLDRAATDLSRGQRQRVTITRLLLSDPRVLFLDEPTTGLDPSAARALRDQLDGLASEGRTLCYLTHNLYEAELLADELVVIKNGTVVASGPKEELVGRLKGEGSREIRIEADVRSEIFDRVGVEARDVRDGWIVTLPTEQSVSELIASLVEHGAAIEAVHEEEATLEDLYSKLTEDEEMMTE
ncbi:ABC transporter ATP-binding protein [Haloterrigena sp. H1]|uniref:ABC transporter ATP-binding protein n=1 Tax=Haloterrigena sp. H1 TaxID=2552943 RepID=UPI0014869F57|nr:ABC transporter ATP-binding protein [Haloterrigena sp. H1]